MIKDQKKWYRIGAIGVGLFIIVFLFTFYDKEGQSTASAAELISQIKSTKQLDIQVKLYKDLIDVVGPDQAQEELRHSGLPFTGQTHLLNHTVGEFLYKNYGPSGLSHCKDYFLSSCNHGFLIMAIAKGGMPEVTKVMLECRKISGAVYGQCSHGVGHGFLAYEGYDKLLESLKLCDEVDIPGTTFPTYNCYDGVFMENIWGVHEGKPSPDRWVKESDPIYPCNDTRIERKYLLACWSNQPALMYQMFDRDLKKISSECEKITDTEYLKMCFNGLSRQIHPITHGKVENVLRLCKEISQSWQDYCVTTNALAYFALGDLDLPFVICANTGESGKKECYEAVIGSISFGNKDAAALCNKISETVWREKCLKNKS
jgi:hypothetical protein